MDLAQRRKEEASEARVELVERDRLHLVGGLAESQREIADRRSGAVRVLGDQPLKIAPHDHVAFRGHDGHRIRRTRCPIEHRHLAEDRSGLGMAQRQLLAGTGDQRQLYPATAERNQVIALVAALEEHGALRPGAVDCGRGQRRQCSSGKLLEDREGAPVGRPRLCLTHMPPSDPATVSPQPETDGHPPGGLCPG